MNGSPETSENITTTESAGKREEEGQMINKTASFCFLWFALVLSLGNVYIGCHKFNFYSLAPRIQNCVPFNSRFMEIYDSVMTAILLLSLLLPAAFYPFLSHVIKPKY